MDFETFPEGIQKKQRTKKMREKLKGLKNRMCQYLINRGPKREKKNKEELNIWRTANWNFPTIRKRLNELIVYQTREEKISILTSSDKI